MLITRLQKLQKAIQNLDCDAFIVDDPINLYYMTGLQLSHGSLFVYNKGAYLIVDGRYFELCKKNTSLPVILAEPNHKALLSLLNNECADVKKIGFSIEDTTYKGFLDFQQCIHTMPATRGLSILPVASPLKKLRAIKDSNEIDTLRKAAQLGAQGFDFICTLLKEGISETELATELEIFWKRKGGKGLAFEPIIAFGVNSSMPHYRAGTARLNKGDAVLIDIGVNFQHYHSDMTRVVFFGQPDPKLEEIYAIVKKAQKAALDACMPGTSLGQLDRIARNVIAEKGYGDFFTHSLGHGVGLEIHEWPTIRNAPPYQDVLLEPGMVLTIEPGIYLPDIGGVRLEDTVAITTNGHENLTQRLL